MCTCCCENKEMVEPVRIGILKDDFIAAMNLLSQARSPRIEFRNDLEKMREEALEETIKKVSEAYSLLAKDHSNF